MSKVVGSRWSLVHSQARSWGFVLLWTTLMVFSARFLFSHSGVVLPLVWVLLFAVAATLTMSRDVVLAQLLAFLVFFEQSIWYIPLADIETIYEIEIFYVKPIEILVLMTIIRVIFSRNIIVIFPKHLFILSAGWLFVIFLGLGVAVTRGVDLYDIFIFSEFRTLLLALAMIFCLLALTVDRLVFFVNLLIIFAAAKALITALSLALGVDLLWPASAQNYVGDFYAFYGSDENIRVSLLALTFCLTHLVVIRSRSLVEIGGSFSKPLHREETGKLPRWLLVAVLVILGFAVVFSNLKQHQHRWRGRMLASRSTLAA